MNIKEKKINYINDFPCEARLCRIKADEPHFHSKELEFIYCLEGEVTLTAGHQNVVIQAGEIFSVDFRDIHYLKSDVDNLVLIAHLNLAKLDMPWENLEYVFFSCESCHCHPYQRKAMEEVKDILLTTSYALHSFENANREAIPRIGNSSLSLDFIAADEIKRASNRLLDIMLKYFNWFNYNAQDDYTNTEAYTRYYNILAYCNKNYMNKITISQLAEREHINANYFSQFIGKTMFVKFSGMLKFIRCFEAEHLLLKTSLPISEISYKCGFSDPKYFYSAFKHWWGCTPTEHRKRYIEYIKRVEPVEVITASEAMSLIEDHMTKWMLEKTLR